MVILDANIVIVALPSIEEALNFSEQGLQWVISAYALTFAGLLLLGGRAADLLGAAGCSWSGSCSSRSPRSCAAWPGARRPDRSPRDPGRRGSDHDPHRHVDHCGHLRGRGRLV